VTANDKRNCVECGTRCKSLVGVNGGQGA
jgi:anaerobic selenocysteine-containing dehydrogenase